ncbi:uncharacterized protein LOC134854694 [Symsagittifera roscoffensis]|uniref:uncharacterized protein LOC134854694 n=1 Tax=Symsagittifera roscoffensis TaxID=84072 RepID=UPI00307B9E9C
MALTGLGLKIDQCDLIWVHVLAKKLDSETRRQWELSCAGSDMPKIKQMKKFLEERSRALEATKDLQLPSIHRKNHQGSSDQSGNSKKDDKETTILQNGRFTVQLPFKPNSQLGDSLAQAKRRFNYLERRLEQNPELKDRYTAFIDEFLDMGHMEYIPPGEIEKPVDSVYYLPHHCVFKEDSTTTKLRVVFDGSATTSTGQSLNDTLMVGPTVQDDLYSIIMRFRFYPIALSADIAKMYRQVALEDKSKDFHRILWRSNKSDEIKHLRMTRVTYGIASSAFHSTRCLNEVANQSKNPMIKESLKNCFYVDDFLGGANDKHEAKKLISDLCEELNSYEFPLRKWTLSNAKIIEGLPEHLREKSDVLELFSDEYKIKALGVSWKPNKDIFLFFNCLTRAETAYKEDYSVHNLKIV